MPKAIEEFAFPKTVSLTLVEGGLAVVSDRGTGRKITKRITAESGSEQLLPELFNRLLMFDKLQQAIGGMLLSYRKNNQHLSLSPQDRGAFKYATAVLRKSRGSLLAIDIPAFNSAGKEFMELLDNTPLPTSQQEGAF